jgi:vitamin B12 transporter
MSKKHFFLIASWLATGSLMAQRDTAVKQLDQVVVTATRYPIKQSQTGKLIIVITKEELDKSRAKTLGEVLNEQAGVIVNGSLNDAGTPQTINIRGGGSGRALITIDGMPVGDPSSINDEFDINLLPVENIERIEICKGAQSTLYGSDAIAGVINIITIKPEIQKPFGAMASVGAGNYGTYKANAQVFGKLADQLLYNIRYGGLVTKGYSTAYDSTGKGNFDQDGFHGGALTANLAWKACAPLTVKAFAQYSSYITQLDAAPFTDAKDYNSTNKNLMAGGGFILKIPGTTINGNYLYSNFSRDFLEDSVFGQTYYLDNYSGRTQYVELFASSSLGSGFTLLNGADYRYASMHETGVAGTYPLRFPDTSISQTSMYSSLSYTGKSGLNAELGGRLNTNSRYGSNATYSFNPSFLFTQNWKGYASVSTGFKAPSLYQLYGGMVGNPNLQPERSTTYEAGAQFNNQMLNIRLTYFYRQILDGIDYNYFTNQYYNYDQQKAQGIEWENKIQISKILSVTANYTFLKVKQYTQSRVTYADTVYDYALRTPANALNITLSIMATKKFLVSLSAHYESTRYDFGGYNASFSPLPDVNLASFYTLNAYLEYHFTPAFKLFFNGKNITNQKFFTIYGYNSMPLMLLGGVALSL